MALFGRKVSLDDDLWQRIEARVGEVGFSSVEEFVVHCIEKELDSGRTGAASTDDDKLKDRLRGLGYIE